jgi:phage-related protein
LPARFYRSDSGREPVREWLKSLDAEDRRIIGEDIKDVEFSSPTGMPLVRSLGRELWEVRSSLPHGRIARVIFCVEKDCMVLLHGFMKKTRKTPKTGNRSGAATEEGDGIMKKENIGSTFDSWLREEGLYEKVSATAIKRVVARQVAAAMQQKGLTKVEMARRMRTSRAALDRLLDPENDAVTLGTLRKAAAVVGRQVRLELV